MALLPLSLISCSKSAVESGEDRQVRVRMQLSAASGGEINEVTAWRFESGFLQEVLRPVDGSAEDVLVFSPEENSGRMYFMANASGLNAAGQFVPGEGREEDFTAMTAHVDEMMSGGLLMTGQVELGGSPGGTITVGMLRPVARIDLYTPEAEVQVTGISISGLGASGYVWPQQEVGSSSDMGSLDFRRDYSAAPLSDVREVLLYVPEQSMDQGAEVEIEALVSGGLHRLRVSLPETLLRNNVYTVQVRGNGTGVSASLLYGGWESGGASSSDPVSSVSVDMENSLLGEGVRVSPGRDTVYFPYVGGSWRLALDAAPGTSASVEGSVRGVSVTVGEGALAVDISGELRMPGTEDALMWINVSEDGVNTGKVALVFDASPVIIGGMIVLDENGTCDFGRYVDGELGTVEIPSDKVLTVETASEALWLRADKTGDSAGVSRYRVLGGWRPNDPTADGRTQQARLVIADEDGRNREEYIVRRRNWGLPVVKMGNTWWTKYNLRGDVRSFEDQITCNEDPVTGRNIMEVLESISSDSLLLMMGDQYQAGFHEGLPLRHDGEVFYHEGMRPSGQNFGLLDPQLMAPDGYQVPGYDDYAWLSANDNHNIGGVGTRTYNNRHGDLIRVTVVERDVDFLGYNYGTVSFYGFESGESQWALFGLGHQWINTAGSIARMHLLLATHGNADKTWVMEGYAASDRPGQNWLKFTPQNHIKTRTIRCIKTPVEYIY